MTDSFTESLDEALWYALFSAWPEAADASKVSVLVVTDAEWAEVVEARLLHPEKLNRDFVGD